MLDQVEERLLAPLDVVEHADERRACSSSSLRKAQAISSAVVPSSVSPKQRAERGRCGRIGGQRVQLLQHLHHRPVGDPLAVGQAAAADDRRLDRGEELGRQPRLADAGIPDHGHELAPSLVEGALPGCLQALQLA